jgi:hypothetical protein
MFIVNLDPPVKSAKSLPNGSSASLTALFANPMVAPAGF